ncbi:hypothetical protein, partial [Pseudomonas syringae group genomosp. 3]|uniref:hypothetical protein n=1 Tax=Pseudomonas syringae group genomosp. 3 TaxID=251701 RepID=UPI001EE46C57
GEGHLFHLGSTLHFSGLAYFSRFGSLFQSFLREAFKLVVGGTQSFELGSYLVVFKRFIAEFLFQAYMWAYTFTWATFNCWS